MKRKTRVSVCRLFFLFIRERYRKKFLPKFKKLATSIGNVNPIFVLLSTDGKCGTFMKLNFLSALPEATVSRLGFFVLHLLVLHKSFNNQL